MNRIRRILGLAVLVFLGGKMAVLLANLWWFPTLVAAAHRPDGNECNESEPITMLVPARNEAHRLPTSLPGLLAAGASEVIFLDDQSTDGTQQVIENASGPNPGRGADGEWTGPRPASTPTSLAIREPLVRVVRGSDRPDGWVGKTWPCEQLAELTDADLLVFCDADVDLAPGALPVVIAEMRRQDADVFSVICRQRAVTWGERLLTPLITDVILCLFPFGLLRAPAPSAATAEGMLLVFRRSAYDKLGGFAAVRGEIVEDVAIARLTRRHGQRLGLVLGGDLVQCRMYTNYREIVTGMGRGLAPVVGGRRGAVVAGWLLHLLAYTAPVVLFPRSTVWKVAALLGLSERVLVEAKTGGRDWPAALAVSLSPIAALPVVLRAMRRTHTWKGRQY